MIAMPELLMRPAEEAGMKVPPDVMDYETHDYPHWHVYTIMQIGRPIIGATSHWTNAKIVAAIPDDVIQNITAGELEAKGFQ